MWESLKQADIERAKQELKARRGEILKRHAEELKGLDNDQAEIDALDRLAGEFFQKFRNGVAARPPAAKKEAAETPVAQAEPEDNTAPPPPAGPHHAEPEKLEGVTNFDIFSRAVSNSSF